MNGITTPDMGWAVLIAVAVSLVFMAWDVFRDNKPKKEKP